MKLSQILAESRALYNERMRSRPKRPLTTRCEGCGKKKGTGKVNHLVLTCSGCLTPGGDNVPTQLESFDFKRS